MLSRRIVFVHVVMADVIGNCKRNDTSVVCGTAHVPLLMLLGGSIFISAMRLLASIVFWTKRRLISGIFDNEDSPFACNLGLNRFRGLRSINWAGVRMPSPPRPNPTSWLSMLGLNPTIARRTTGRSATCRYDNQAEDAFRKRKEIENCKQRKGAG